MSYRRIPYIIPAYTSNNVYEPRRIMYDNVNSTLYIKGTTGNIELGTETILSLVYNKIELIKNKVDGDYDTFNKIKLKLDSLIQWKRENSMLNNTVDSVLYSFSNLKFNDNILDIINSMLDSNGTGGFSDNNFTLKEKYKLDIIQDGANLYTHPIDQVCDYVNPVTKVNDMTGDVELTRETFGFGNVHPNANLYIHPNIKQCKVFSVTSINSKNKNVVVDKNDISLNNIDNYRLATLYEIELGSDKLYIAANIATSYINNKYSGIIDYEGMDNITNTLTVITNKEGCIFNIMTKNGWETFTITGTHTSLNLHPGEYIYQVSHPQRLDYIVTGEVDITSRPKTVNIEIIFKFTLEITSDVLGSTITIRRVYPDGTFGEWVDINYARTSALMDEGLYEYKVSKTEYIDTTGTVVLNKDTLIEVSLEAKVYKLTVIITPVNANFKINIAGVVTSDRIIYVRRGTYLYSADLPGYFNKSSSVNVTADMTLNLILELKPTYSLNIDTKPLLCDVYTKTNDGSETYLGKSPKVITGLYKDDTVTMRATYPDYVDYSKTIKMLSSDKYETLSLTPSPPDNTLTVKSTGVGTIYVYELYYYSNYVQIGKSNTDVTQFEMKNLNVGKYKVVGEVNGVEVEEIFDMPLKGHKTINLDLPLYSKVTLLVKIIPNTTYYVMIYNISSWDRGSIILPSRETEFKITKRGEYNYEVRERSTPSVVVKSGSFYISCNSLIENRTIDLSNDIQIEPPIGGGITVVADFAFTSSNIPRITATNISNNSVKYYNISTLGNMAELKDLTHDTNYIISATSGNPEPQKLFYISGMSKVIYLSEKIQSGPIEVTVNMDQEIKMGYMTIMKKRYGEFIKSDIVKIGRPQTNSKTVKFLLEAEEYEGLVEFEIYPVNEANFDYIIATESITQTHSVFNYSFDVDEILVTLTLNVTEQSVVYINGRTNDLYRVLKGTSKIRTVKVPPNAIYSCDVCCIEGDSYVVKEIEVKDSDMTVTIDSICPLPRGSGIKFISEGVCILFTVDGKGEESYEILFDGHGTTIPLYDKEKIEYKVYCIGTWSHMPWLSYGIDEYIKNKTPIHSGTAIAENYIKEITVNAMTCDKLSGTLTIPNCENKNVYVEPVNKSVGGMMSDTSNSSNKVFNIYKGFKYNITVKCKNGCNSVDLDITVLTWETETIYNLTDSVIDCTLPVPDAPTVDMPNITDSCKIYFNITPRDMSGVNSRIDYAIDQYQIAGNNISHNLVGDMIVFSDDRYIELDYDKLYKLYRGSKLYFRAKCLDYNNNEFRGEVLKQYQPVEILYSDIYSNGVKSQHTVNLDFLNADIEDVGIVTIRIHFVDSQGSNVKMEVDTKNGSSYVLDMGNIYGRYYNSDLDAYEVNVDLSEITGRVRITASPTGSLREAIDTIQNISRSNTELYLTFDSYELPPEEDIPEVTTNTGFIMMAPWDQTRGCGLVTVGIRIWNKDMQKLVKLVEMDIDFVEGRYGDDLITRKNDRIVFDLKDVPPGNSRVRLTARGFIHPATGPAEDYVNDNLYIPAKATGPIYLDSGASITTTDHWKKYFGAESIMCSTTSTGSGGSNKIFVSFITKCNTIKSDWAQDIKIHKFRNVKISLVDTGSNIGGEHPFILLGTLSINQDSSSASGWLNVPRVFDGSEASKYSAIYYTVEATDEQNNRVTSGANTDYIAGNSYLGGHIDHFLNVTDGKQYTNLPICPRTWFEVKPSDPDWVPFPPAEVLVHFRVSAPWDQTKKCAVVCKAIRVWNHQTKTARYMDVNFDKVKHEIDKDQHTYREKEYVCFKMWVQSGFNDIRVTANGWINSWGGVPEDYNNTNVLISVNDGEKNHFDVDYGDTNTDVVAHWIKVFGSIDNMCR